MNPSVETELERTTSRRIPKRLNQSDELFRGITLDDFAVAGGVPVAIVVLSAYFLPEVVRVYGFLLAGVTFLAGSMLVLACPPYLTTSEWVGTYVAFWRRSKHLTHVRYQFDHVEREQRDLPESKPFETSARTQDLTYVKRIYPRDGIIERIDDRMYGGISISPANMALQTDRRWRDNVDAFTDFLNTSVEFPMQIFATNRPFDTDAFLASYQRRLNDDDVRDNPVFQALIEEWLAWYPTELELRGTNIRAYYLLISIGPEDVQRGFAEPDSAKRLNDLPGIGRFLTGFTTEELPEEDRAAEMRQLLDERLTTVESGAVRGIAGCSTTRLTAAELAGLLKEFWEGESIEEEAIEDIVRRRGIVNRREPEVMKPTGSASQGSNNGDRRE